MPIVPRVLKVGVKNVLTDRERRTYTVGASSFSNIPHKVAI